LQSGPRTHFSWAWHASHSNEPAFLQAPQTGGKTKLRRESASPLARLRQVKAGNCIFSANDCLTFILEIINKGDADTKKQIAPFVSTQYCGKPH
jgi:hypothetical protein